MPSQDSILAKLDTKLAANKPDSSVKRAHYRAAINWLKKQAPQLNSSSSLTNNYLQALYHFSKIQYKEAVDLILEEPLNIFIVEQDFPLSCSEYLILRGEAANLLASINETLNDFSTTSIDINNITTLQARSLAGLGRLEEACRILEDLYLEVVPGDKPHIQVVTYLGIYQIQAGKYKEGISKLRYIEGTFKNNDFSPSVCDLMATVVENFAFYEMSKGYFYKALELYSQSFSLREKSGNEYRSINPLVHQGIIYRRACVPAIHWLIFLISRINSSPMPIKFRIDSTLNKNYQLAMQYLQQARMKAEKFRDESTLTWIFHHLAWVYINTGNYELAEDYCHKSLQGYEKIKDQRGLADCYEQLGFIYLAELKKARDLLIKSEIYYRKSLSIREKSGNIHGIASCTLNLSLVEWHKKRYFASLKFLMQSFTLYNKLEILNFTRVARITSLFFVWTIGKRMWTM